MSEQVSATKTVNRISTDRHDAFYRPPFIGHTVAEDRQSADQVAA